MLVNFWAEIRLAIALIRNENLNAGFHCICVWDSNARLEKRSN